MCRNRAIRNEYEDIVNVVCEIYDLANFRPAHAIPSNATIEECLKYTQTYLMGGERNEQHYRYDYYLQALQEMSFDFENCETLLHVDIGCGPGLFTWVVQDHFRASPHINLKLYGYDHSPNMVQLANSFWSRFEEETHYSCHDCIEDFYATALPEGQTPCDVLVTFGYVLVQTIGDQSAIGDFVNIVENVAALGDCRILAVDGRSEANRETFREACRNLAAALENRRLIVSYNGRRGYCVPDFGSKMFADIAVGE